MTDEKPKDTLAPYRALLGKMDDKRLAAEVRRRRAVLYANEEEARSSRRESTDHDALDAMSFRVSEDRARLALAERELQRWQEKQRREVENVRASFALEELRARAELEREERERELAEARAYLHGVGVEFLPEEPREPKRRRKAVRR